MQHSWDFFKPSGLYPVVRLVSSLAHADCRCVCGTYPQHTPIACQAWSAGTAQQVKEHWYEMALSAQFDGKESVASYLLALDRCHKRLCERWEAVHSSPLRLASIEFCVFHAPFNKMARKAAARLWQLDAARCLTLPLATSMQQSQPGSFAAGTRHTRRACQRATCCHSQLSDFTWLRCEQSIDGWGGSTAISTSSSSNSRPCSDRSDP